MIWDIKAESWFNLEYIIDFTKGYELDATDTDFEVQAKSDDKFLCFTLFDERLVHISETRCVIVMGLGLKGSISNG